MASVEHVGIAGEDLSADTKVGLAVFMDTSDSNKIKVQTTVGGPIAGILTQGNGDDRPVRYVSKGFVRGQAGAAIAATASDSLQGLMVEASTGKLIVATTGKVIVGDYIPEVHDGTLMAAVDTQNIGVELVGHNHNLVP